MTTDKTPPASAATRLRRCATSRPTRWPLPLTMRERPIPFSAPMVRAILAGTKTQTRRAVKWREPAPGLNLSFSGLGVERTWSAVDGAPEWVLGAPTRSSWEWRSKPTRCPYGQPGDLLWVREAWRASSAHDDLAPRDIPVGDGIEYGSDPERILTGKLRPGMFMPRWASRITLAVTDVRVERLQDISAKDILAEGSVARPHKDQFGRNPVSRFDGKVYLDLRSLWAAGWESINGPGSWDANPWVWVIEFRPTTTWPRSTMRIGRQPHEH